MKTEIFREYDIRGVVPTTINEDVAYTIGRSFGTYIKRFNSNKVLVGYDNRISSPDLANSLIKGILDSGTDVVNLGLVTTPMYYYGRVLLNIWSGIMITASHNPADNNGFKISFTNLGNACGKEIYDFRDFTFTGNFDSGEGNYTTYDVRKEYIDLIKNSLDLKKKIKVVVDCGCGTGSVIIEDVLRELNIEYDLLYCESDGTFPAHHPDPAVRANLADLQKRVVELNYDFGFAVDADADRVGIVDNKGNIINVDIFMAIMYKGLYDKLKVKKAIYDVKCSKALADELDKLGIEKIMNRTGNSYQYRKVQEIGVDFGGEYSGHIFFNDKFPGFDDGIYSGLRLAELLSNIDENLSDLTKDINKYYSTEELKIQVTEETKFEIVDGIKKYASNRNYQYNDIDGVRVEFTDGWALVRASNTGPNLTVRFEANTEERLKEIQEEFTLELNKLI